MRVSFKPNAKVIKLVSAVRGEGRVELGGGGLQPSTFRLKVSGEYQTTTSATSRGEERIKISPRRRETVRSRKTKAATTSGARLSLGVKDARPVGLPVPSKV